MPPERDDDGLVLDRQHCRLRRDRACPAIGRRRSRLPLRHGLLVRRENDSPDRFLIRLTPVALGQRPQAFLTMLYRSTDRRRRRGAPGVNLAHSASFHSREKHAPSKPGIKHLVVTLTQLQPWQLRGSLLKLLVAEEGLEPPTRGL